jgi:CRP-like cAMP-binding protein
MDRQRASGDGSWTYGTLLSRLAVEERVELLGLGARRAVATGEVLLRQGDCGTHVILLREGLAKISKTTAGGHEALLGLRMAGDLVGEMSALNRRPRSATVTSCGPGTVSLIHQPVLQDFLGRHPRAALELAGMVADRLRAANQFRIEFTAYPASVRLARVIAKVALTYGHRTPEGLVVGVELTQVELASLCGAAEVTIQKTLQALRRDGVVATGYRQLTVLDLDALRRRAELDQED